MSIRTRILAMVGAFAVLAAVIVALGLMTLNDYSRMMARFDHANVNAWRGERFNHLVSRVVMESRGLYMAPGETDAMVFAGNLNAHLDEMETLLAEWRGASTPQEAVRLKPLADTAVQFITLRREVARLGAAGDSRGAAALGLSNREARIAFQAELDKMVATTRAELAIARTDAEAYSQQRAMSFFATALIGTLAILALSLWMVARFITRPLRTLASAIVRTSDGDYGLALADGKGQDEVSSVWRALAALRERAMAAETLARAQREAEQREALKMREILLD